MNRNIVGLLAVLVVIGGGWYMFRGTPEITPVENTTETSVATTTSTGTASTTSSGVTIIYSAQGFSPASTTIPLGTTVTFVNQSTKNMWVASAKHPTHTAYSGTSLSQHCPDTTNSAFDECTAGAPGSSFSFTFNKEGTWKYHDHIDASKFGSITVTASSTPVLQN